MLVASIDIGSNAARLLICNAFRDQNEPSTYRIVQSVRVPIRLGDYVFIDKFIPQNKENELLLSMKAFALLMEIYKVEQYRACATASLREAQNREKILEDILRTTGLNIEVIDGIEEANLIVKANEHLFKNPDQKTVLVDVGGGSTEISLMMGSKRLISKSFALGTVRILDNQDDEKTWESLHLWIKNELKPHKPDHIIGTGGNINKIFKLLEVNDSKFADLKELSLLYSNMSQLSLKERISRYQLNTDRADVILPAMHIFLTVMNASKIQKIRTSNMGLKEGIVVDLLQKIDASTPANEKKYRFNKMVGAF